MYIYLFKRGVKMEQKEIWLTGENRTIKIVLTPLGGQRLKSLSRIVRRRIVRKRYGIYLFLG